MDRTLLNSCTNSHHNYHRHITKVSGVDLVCVSIQKFTSLSRVYVPLFRMEDLDFKRIQIFLALLVGVNISVLPLLPLLPGVLKYKQGLYLDKNRTKNPKQTNPTKQLLHQNPQTTKTEHQNLTKSKRSEYLRKNLVNKSNSDFSVKGTSALSCTDISPLALWIMQHLCIDIKYTTV